MFLLCDFKSSQISKMCRISSKTELKRTICTCLPLSLLYLGKACSYVIDFLFLFIFSLFSPTPGFTTTMLKRRGKIAVLLLSFLLQKLDNLSTAGLLSKAGPGKGGHGFTILVGAPERRTFRSTLNLYLPC